jgi:ribonuclease D
MITDYQWIDDNSDLEELILSIKASDEVAFDSEFERVNSFYPKPALFQLRINDDYYLIDMKEISNHNVFTNILDNIILHSGSEDLEILLNLNNQLPTQIFDTQIAASLCGYGLHFSYQNIVKELLGIELSKAHSRSDWMQRPLSDEQIDYALEDVIYLPELKAILLAKLKEQERMAWFDLLMQQRKQSIVDSNHVTKTFVKMSQTKRIDAEQQKLLYLLLNWREETAIKRDKPRGWILKNDQILKIIQKKPQSHQALIDNVGLYPKFVKYNASALFDLFKEAEKLDAEVLPTFNQLTSAQGQKMAEEKQKLLSKCEELNISPALVINMSDLKALAAADKDLSDIKLWQLINSV